MIFQEKHTSGHLWWKKTYYTYWRVIEGSVHQMSRIPLETIAAVENK